MSLPSYQPRRAVPWGVIELLFAAAMLLGAQAAAVLLASNLVGPPTRPVAEYEPAANPDSRHPTLQLFVEGGPAIVLLCVISAAVAAPLYEEFFFRVLLQGWLEKVERRLRRLWPGVRRVLPRAWGPIVLSSLFFAAMHPLKRGPTLDAEFLKFALAGVAAGSMLAALAVVVLFRWLDGATAEDFGCVPQTFWPDVRLGLRVFAVVAVPIFALQVTLNALLPANISPDPLTLFPFALVLGWLYWRTRRLAPIVVLHAALNGTSLLLAWLLSLAAGGGG